MGNKFYCWIYGLVLILFSGVSIGEEKAEVEVKTLKVMTFNVRYGLALDRKNSWEKRKDIVVEAIKKYSPEIFGLQESFPFQTEYIHENLEGYSWFGIDREAVGVGEMCPIFYRKDRFLLMESATRWLSNTPEVPGSNSWRAAFPRIVTWGKFKDLESGEFLYVYNTHYDHRSRYARSKSTQLIINMVNDQVELGQRLIVLGDFNENATSSDSHQRYLAAQFKDSWHEALKKTGPPITFSKFSEPGPDDDPYRIDWILYRGDLNVLECETVLYNEDGRFPSDHLPVFAKLVYQKEESESEND